MYVWGGHPEISVCIGALPTYNYLFPSLFSDLPPEVICIPVFTDNPPDAPKAPREAKPWRPFFAWTTFGVGAVIQCAGPVFRNRGASYPNPARSVNPKKETLGQNPGFPTTTTKDTMTLGAP